MSYTPGPISFEYPCDLKTSSSLSSAFEASMEMTRLPIVSE